MDASASHSPGTVVIDRGSSGSSRRGPQEPREDFPSPPYFCFLFREIITCGVGLHSTSFLQTKIIKGGVVGGVPSQEKVDEHMALA